MCRHVNRFKNQLRHTDLNVSYLVFKSILILSQTLFPYNLPPEVEETLEDRASNMIFFLSDVRAEAKQRIEHRDYNKIYYNQISG
jgi:hypothetical protein